MLKACLYFNWFFYGLLSILICKNSFSKNSKINWAIEAIILMLLSFINLLLFDKCMEIDWNFLFIVPVFAVTEVLYLISFFRCIFTRKEKHALTTLPAVVLAVVPAMLFIGSYTYEMIKLNTCDYLVKYNYQSGMVISEDTFFAVKQQKAAKVTLVNNLFNRKSIKEYTGIATNIQCSIDFSDKDDMKIIMYDDRSRAYEPVFRELGTEIFKANPNENRIEIHYIPEKKDAIVRFFNAGDYLYHETERVCELKTHGDLDEIIVYKQ